MFLAGCGADSVVGERKKMEAKIKLLETDDIPVEITITMPLRTWKQFAQQLTDKYPSTQVDRVICDLIHKMTKQVETETPFEGVR